MSTQKQYFDQVYTDVLAAAKLRAVAHPEIIARLGAAQSCLETGYGAHTIGGNYFGIKAVAGEPGVTAPTKEFVDGQWVTIDAAFAAHGSPEASALAYVDFLLRYPRYHDVLAAATDEAAITAIGASGYATAPDYADTVRSIMQQYAGPAVVSSATAPSPAAPAATAQPDTTPLSQVDITALTAALNRNAQATESLLDYLYAVGKALAS